MVFAECGEGKISQYIRQFVAFQQPPLPSPSRPKPLDETKGETKAEYQYRSCRQHATLAVLPWFPL